MTSITVILTCYNRREHTKKCIESLWDNHYRMRYVVTDDASTDGTHEMLDKLKADFHIKILEGDGSLYWCGGMRKAMADSLEQENQTDYYVLVNDDVEFVDKAIQKAIGMSKRRDNSIIVGAICDYRGELTYGGIKFQGQGLRYITVGIHDERICDSFNCNFVLLPGNIFRVAGNFDSHYRHAMADFDYGLHIRRIGYLIYSSEEYLGFCERNDISGTWRDRTLSRIERIRKKEMPKGLPTKEWFYYVKKNFGLRKAVWYSATPYLRILAGR